jgi:hypothetical protein
MKRNGVLVTLITVNLAIEQLENNKCVFKKNNFLTADEMGFKLNQKCVVKEHDCFLMDERCPANHLCVKFKAYSDKFKNLGFENKEVETCIKKENVFDFANTYGYDFYQIQETEYEKKFLLKDKNEVFNFKQIIQSYENVGECKVDKDGKTAEEGKEGKNLNGGCYQICEKDDDCEDYGKVTKEDPKDPKDKILPSLRKCFSLKKRANDEGYLFDPEPKPEPFKICRKGKTLNEFIKRSKGFQKHGYKPFPIDIEIRDDESWGFLDKVKLKVEKKINPGEYEVIEFGVYCPLLYYKSAYNLYRLNKYSSFEEENRGVCNNDENNLGWFSNLRTKMLYDFDGHKNLLLI